MDTQPIVPGAGLKSATPLTPLQLNAIKLDVKHTVLTPDYLEKLEEGQNGGPMQP